MDPTPAYLSLVISYMYIFRMSVYMFKMLFPSIFSYKNTQNKIHLVITVLIINNINIILCITAINDVTNQ